MARASTKVNGRNNVLRPTYLQGIELKTPIRSPDSRENSFRKLSCLEVVYVVRCKRCLEQETAKHFNDAYEPQKYYYHKPRTGFGKSFSIILKR